jgi:tRNA(Ile)-lysidine synthase
MSQSSVSSEPVEAALLQSLTAYPDAQVWVGFSGGLDSTALLLAAKQVQLSRLPDLQINAIHVNHNLHAHSSAWAHHCAEVCAHLDVPLIQATVHVPALGNLEANARRVRYAAYAEHLPSAGVLLLGHHQQDQSETILYRLLQGRGMLTIRPQGRLGSGHFLRPLLTLSRSELSVYVQSHDLHWIEDPTNSDTDLHRNFLRADILPRLKSRWQDADRALSRVAHHHQQTLGALIDTLSRFPDEVPAHTLPTEHGHRRAWLRAYLASREVFAVSDKALDEFIDQQNSAAGFAHLQPGEANIYSYDNRFYFEAKPPTAPLPQRLQMSEDVVLPYGKVQLRQVQADARFAFKAAEPLTVGFRSGGESLRVTAAAGSGPQTYTKSLKQLLNDARIPPWRRDFYPLIFSAGTLVCVPDIAVAHDSVEQPASDSPYWQVHFSARLETDAGQGKK